KPGLVRLPTGARVADAIEAAGGVLPDTDLTSVNLARKLTDGELITVGVDPAATPGGKVSLNAATLAQLDALPGVGPVLAHRLTLTAGRHRLTPSRRRRPRDSRRPPPIPFPRLGHSGDLAARRGQGRRSLARCFVGRAIAGTARPHDCPLWTSPGWRPHGRN